MSEPTNGQAPVRSPARSLVVFVLATMSAVPLIVAATATPALAATHSVEVTVRAVHSGQCLEIPHLSQDDGAQLRQYRCHGGPNQRWRLDTVSSDIRLMTSAASGKCADVAGAATHDGAVVQQYQCHGGANQQWRLVPVSGDAFNIVAVHSGKCLDVAGAATHDYAPVHQWSCTPPGAANQQWRVVLAAQVVRDSAQLAPGQEHCTTTRVSYSAGDGWWSNVVFQGSATAAITGWTIWYDNVDGNDGFGNRKWVAGWANSISRIFNAQQVDRNDNTTGIKDYWFCAKNTTSWHIAADFHIANEIRQFTPPPPWTITPTGNHSWTVQGRLAPGERACAPGTAGRTGWIEAFIGLQLADVTLTNSATTKTVTTTIGAQFTIDSANPGLPDAIFGCVRNRDTVSLNFLFNFSAA